MRWRDTVLTVQRLSALDFVLLKSMQNSCAMSLRNQVSLQIIPKALWRGVVKRDIIKRNNLYVDMTGETLKNKL